MNHIKIKRSIGKFRSNIKKQVQDWYYRPNSVIILMEKNIQIIKQIIFLLL